MTKLERIFLRLLTHNDISDRYLKWFKDSDVGDGYFKKIFCL